MVDSELDEKCLGWACHINVEPDGQAIWLCLVACVLQHSSLRTICRFAYNKPLASFFWKLSVAPHNILLSFTVSKALWRCLIVLWIWTEWWCTWSHIDVKLTGILQWPPLLKSPISFCSYVTSSTAGFWAVGSINFGVWQTAHITWHICSQTYAKPLWLAYSTRF